jgi:molecular chaperone GrpE
MRSNKTETMPENERPDTRDQDSGDEPTSETQKSEAGELELLTQKVGELEASVNTYKDQFLRKAAEFENYKKRVENDIASMTRISTEDLIQKLLPVLDDFERMIKAHKAAEENEGQADHAFIKGVELIYSKYKRILEAQGVKEFDALGKPFDPALHEALMQMAKEGVPGHTVIEEIEKGYTLFDKVIRHARVIVSAEAT